jgi:serpin B
MTAGRDRHDGRSSGVERVMKRLAIVAIILLSGCGPAGSTASPSSPASSAPAVTPSPADTPTAIPSPSAIAGMIHEVRAELDRAVAGDAGGPAARAVAAADAAFALDLYQQLAARPGNLIYSPYSISTALSMTYGGAGGATAAQLAKVLGVGKDPTAWHAGRNDVDGWLQRPIPLDPDGVTPLTIEPTNALFGQDGFPFQDAYLELLARDYGAGLQALDFVADAEAGREAINRWVAEKTKDRIRQLLGPDAVTDATRFVLVNAIYFKASWMTQFETDATKEAAFHRLDGTTTNVPMMHGLVEGNYKRGKDWQAFDIPYVGATMTVILPDAGRFADVEKRLDAGLLADMADHPEFDRITLDLPRWSSKVDLDLVENLKSLGIRDAFEAGVADLRGIADAGLFVGKVIHQATIDVDEHGTVAAAATAVVGDTSGGGPDGEVSVTVDRPFIYMIRDNLSGEILFMGRVLDPTAQ